MKYRVDTSEGGFEPGSDEQVLRNRLGITAVAAMNEAESQLLLKLYESLFEPEFSVESLSFVMLQDWHRKWLGPIYEWAGRLRTVDLSKGGFRFAAAQFLDRQLPDFEQRFLSVYGELPDLSREALVGLLARSHVEFILIHPFREGNGRIARLLMDVMATRAGYGPLDYSLWDEHRDFYFKAIQAGVAGDFQHMARLVRDVLV